MMNYLSVCSGIEAVSVAAKGLPYKAAAYSEVDAYPRALLQHHYPEVPLHGDFTTIKGDEYGSVDLLVGGTPCQSFSVAGNRLGLDDPRGNLAIEFLRLGKRLNTRWLLWENVPGLLSSWSDEEDCRTDEIDRHAAGGDGSYRATQRNDFDTFLSLLRQCGYSACWRVLNAEHFGVPQRRRRIFVVAYLGDWRPAAAVLFEREGLQRDITPRRTEREEAPTYAGTSFAGYREGVSTPLRQYGGDLGGGSENLAVDVPEVAWALQARDAKGADSDTKQGHLIPVAFQHKAGGKTALGYTVDTCPSLVSNQEPAVLSQYRVRRLLPIECERLQGFPDNYTLVPYRGKPAADAPRYKALGNSMPVPVMHWLLDRIHRVDSLLKEV